MMIHYWNSRTYTYDLKGECMKSKKISLLLITSLFSVAGLVACKPSTPKKSSSDSAVVDAKVLSVKLSADAKQIAVSGKLNLTATVETQGNASKAVTFASSDDTVLSVNENGVVEGLKVGKANVTATSVFDANFKDSLEIEVVAPELADGAYSYAYAGGEVKTEILGKLEKFAVESKLTGLTLYGDGGYVLYQPSVVKGTNNYVPGFGFGILSSGSLNADLAGEPNAAWKRYYHTFETSDPQSMNYMDDQGSVVGDLIGYIYGSYFDTFLNEEGNGYDWVAGLAKADRPIPLNEDPVTKMATKFEIPVKVGDELKYATLSTKYAAFNNRPVALEDYITPYQVYYTKSYGLARSAENLDGPGSIKGAAAYYEKSADGFNADAWNNIGIKTATHDGNSYIQFEFNQACTPFYAMYYLASGMFAPVPQEFLLAIGNNDLATGVKNWGKNSEDGKESVLDHCLSSGPYVLERWDADQQIVFKKNANYDDKNGKYYKIAGVHVNILAAQATDPEAALKEFEDNKLHACGVPSTQLEKYLTDPRVTMTSDSSTYKLNLNTCDQELWDELFGPNGSISPRSEWEVEPAMSNKNFVDGLSFGLDRKTLAESLGRTPTANYFGSAYMQDPENGISYNSTEAHKNDIYYLVGEAAGTDEYGYSLEQAKASFKKAAQELIAEGAYEEGDTIEIEIAWQTTAQISTTHNPIATMYEEAFNQSDNPLKLKVNSWVGAVWSDVYYEKMMKGQFDIGFGSISGNTYDPLNFLEVLKSDNSSGFTLNWGTDTNEVTDKLLYDGKYWSFDALWTAADRGAYIVKGANAPLDYSCREDENGVAQVDVTVNGDEVKVVIDVKELNISEGAIKTEFAGAVVMGYTALTDAGSIDTNSYMEVENESFKKIDGAPDGYVRYECIFSLAKIEAAGLNGAVANLLLGYGYAGIDLFYVTTFFGVPDEPTYHYSCFPEAMPGTPVEP